MAPFFPSAISYAIYQLLFGLFECDNGAICKYIMYITLTLRIEHVVTFMTTNKNIFTVLFHFLKCDNQCCFFARMICCLFNSIICCKFPFLSYKTGKKFKSTSTVQFSETMYTRNPSLSFFPWSLIAVNEWI